MYKDNAFPVDISRGHTKSLQTRKELDFGARKNDNNLMLICSDYETFGDKLSLNNTQKYSNNSNLKVRVSFPYF